MPRARRMYRMETVQRAGLDRTFEYVEEKFRTGGWHARQDETGRYRDNDAIAWELGGSEDN